MGQFKIGIGACVAYENENFLRRISSYLNGWPIATHSFWMSDAKPDIVR